MHTADHHGDSGYTFVEILIALTILGIVVVPFLGLFSSSFAAINNSGNQTRAINLCRDKIETLKAEEFASVYSDYITESNNPLIENELVHHPGMQRTTYLESILIETGQEAAPDVEVLLVTVTVTWSSAGRQYSETLQAYLAER